MQFIIPTPIVGLSAIAAAVKASKAIKKAKILRANYLKGKAFEKLVGASQNLVQYAQKRIPSISGTAKYRVADFLTSSALHEIKNVKNLRLTNQLKDFILFSQREGLKMTIHVNKATKITNQLKKLERHGIINIKRH